MAYNTITNETFYMKPIKFKRLLLGICILFVWTNPAISMGGAGQQLTSSVMISGQIRQHGSRLDSGTVYLRFQSDGHMDSVVIRNSRFVIKDTLREASIAWLYFSGAPRKVKALFLEPGSVQFVGDLDELSEASVTGTGASLQVPFEQWNKAWMAIHLEAGKYYEALNAASKGGKQKVPDSIRHYVDQGFLALGKKTDSSVIAFIDQYPNSPVSAYVVVNRYVNYPNEVMLDSCLQLLGAAAKSSYYGRIIRQHYEDYLKTAIGAAPGLSLPDSTGKMLDLQDFKGKYVLVDFWASWCSPCRKENPNIVAAYKTYHKAGLEILGVSLDENKKSWLAAVKKDDLQWPQVSDLQGWKSKPVITFGIKSIPFNFLLDPQGKIVGRNLRGAELEKKLAELISVTD